MKRFFKISLRFLVVGVFLFGVYLFIISPAAITGRSMQPNLMDKDTVLVNKLQYDLVKPKSGDIVVFKSPLNEDNDMISRIIGVGGDTILLKDGLVYLNTTLLNEPYVTGITKPTTKMDQIQNGRELTIPKDSVFVMSDNREHSSDSRSFGVIKTVNLIGVPFLRIAPSDRFSLL